MRRRHHRHQEGGSRYRLLDQQTSVHLFSQRFMSEGYGFSTHLTSQQSDRIIKGTSHTRHVTLPFGAWGYRRGGGTLEDQGGCRSLDQAAVPRAHFVRQDDGEYTAVKIHLTE